MRVHSTIVDIHSNKFCILLIKCTTTLTGNQYLPIIWTIQVSRHVGGCCRRSNDICLMPPMRVESQLPRLLWGDKQNPVTRNKTARKSVYKSIFFMLTKWELREHIDPCRVMCMSRLWKMRVQEQGKAI